MFAFDRTNYALTEQICELCHLNDGFCCGKICGLQSIASISAIAIGHCHEQLNCVVKGVLIIGLT